MNILNRGLIFDLKIILNKSFVGFHASFQNYFGKRRKYTHSDNNEILHYVQSILMRKFYFLHS